MPTHKECINFSNGYCRLFNVPVNPDGPACPNFQPRGTEGQVKVWADRSTSAGYPPAPSYLLPPLWRRVRRRLRRRRGRSLANLWWGP